MRTPRCRRRVSAEAAAAAEAAVAAAASDAAAAVVELRQARGDVIAHIGVPHAERAPAVRVQRLQPALGREAGVKKSEKLADFLHSIPIFSLF